MSHWSSRLTIYFPPQGAAACAPGVQPTLWNWDYLLPVTCYTLFVTYPLLLHLFIPYLGFTFLNFVIFALFLLPPRQLQQGGPTEKMRGRLR